MNHDWGAICDAKMSGTDHVPSPADAHADLNRQLARGWGTNHVTSYTAGSGKTWMAVRKFAEDAIREHTYSSLSDLCEVLGADNDDALARQLVYVAAPTRYEGDWQLASVKSSIFGRMLKQAAEREADRREREAQRRLEREARYVWAGGRIGWAPSEYTFIPQSDRHRKSAQPFDWLGWLDTTSSWVDSAVSWDPDADAAVARVDAQVLNLLPWLRDILATAPGVRVEVSYTRHDARRYWSPCAEAGHPNRPRTRLGRRFREVCDEPPQPRRDEAAALRTPCERGRPCRSFSSSTPSRCYAQRSLSPSVPTGGSSDSAAA